MIQITPQMRILVAIESVDGRKGIDSLAQLCQEKLQADPFSGCLFVFRSRRGTSIRILVYDGQGFWLAQKRLSQGRFAWWPSGKEHDVNAFDYLTELLRRLEELKQNPSEWMPWNYRDTLARLATPAAA